LSEEIHSKLETPTGYYIILTVVIFFLAVMYFTGLLGQFIDLIMVNKLVRSIILAIVIVIIVLGLIYWVIMRD
jgi:hypothetical protein